MSKNKKVTIQKLLGGITGKTPIAGVIEGLHYVVNNGYVSEKAYDKCIKESLLRSINAFEVLDLSQEESFEQAKDLLSSVISSITYTFFERLEYTISKQHLYYLKLYALGLFKFIFTKDKTFIQLLPHNKYPHEIYASLKHFLKPNVNIILSCYVEDLETLMLDASFLYESRYVLNNLQFIDNTPGFDLSKDIGHVIMYMANSLIYTLDKYNFFNTNKHLFSKYGKLRKKFKKVKRIKFSKILKDIQQYSTVINVIKDYNYNCNFQLNNDFLVMQIFSKLSSKSRLSLAYVSDADLQLIIKRAFRTHIEDYLRLHEKEDEKIRRLYILVFQNTERKEFFDSIVNVRVKEHKIEISFVDSLQFKGRNYKSQHTDVQLENFVYPILSYRRERDTIIELIVSHLIY